MQSLSEWLISSWKKDKCRYCHRYVPERANIIAGEGGHEINIGAITNVSAYKEKVNIDVDVYEKIDKDDDEHID